MAIMGEFLPCCACEAERLLRMNSATCNIGGGGWSRIELEICPMKQIVSTILCCRRFGASGGKQKGPFT